MFFIEKVPICYHWVCTFGRCGEVGRYEDDCFECIYCKIWDDSFVGYFIALVLIGWGGARVLDLEGGLP